MRDRLIELIKSKSCQFYECSDNRCEECEHIALFNDDIEKMADFILADGWMRPPCQEKDEFFILEKTQDGTQVTKLIVRFVSIYKNRFEIYCDTEARDGGYHFEPCRIGEDIYYTKEEAEQALIGGGQE